MSTSTNILVNIIGEFKKKGFDDADKATKKLNTGFEKLGKKLAAAFSVAAVAKFAKQSIKAFEEDQRAAVRLTGTLKNMGLAFEDLRMQQFIGDLEKQSGVLDDSLRPAMQGLLTTTGSLTKSQELLNLAIEISRGTGAELTTVAKDLGRAYVGQTRGLSKYSMGLTQAELKGKSFAEIQQLLNKQFAGQQAAYLETYSGKVDMVKVAYANLQEIVGEELINSFTVLSGEKGIQGSTSAMDKASRSLGDLIAGFTEILRIFKELDAKDYFRRFADFFGGVNFDVTNPKSGFTALRKIITRDFGDAFKDINLANPISALKVVRDIGKETRLMGKTGATGFMPLGQYKAQQAARTKAENAAAKRARELARLQGAALKREKEAQALKRAGTVFDMENIQIVAALQGKVSEDQRLRLTALLAINNKNADAAEKLSLAILATNAAAFEALGVTIKTGDNIDTVITKLINAQTSLGLVAKGITDLPKAKNPFEGWTDVIAAILAQVAALNKALTSLPKLPAGTVAGMPGANGATGGAGRTTSAAASSAAAGTVAGVGSGVIFSSTGTPFLVPKDVTASAFDDPSMWMEGFSAVLSNPHLNWQKVGDTFVTNVTVSGSVISEGDLANTIADELYKAQKSGKSLLVSSVSI